MRTQELEIKKKSTDCLVYRFLGPFVLVPPTEQIALIVIGECKIDKS